MSDDGVVFMPIALGAFVGWTKRELAQIGTIYGNRREHVTVPSRSINGYPMFAAFGMVHVDDWTRAREAINAELDRRKEIKV